MGPTGTVGQLARKVIVAAVLLAGLLALVVASAEAFGGVDKLWSFVVDEPSRFTSMALLTGTFRLRSALSQLGPDEQVYNGAAYTNWGFGVPILQLPFHALARKMSSLPGGFFPDRAIYFFYLTALAPVLWAALDRALALRAPHGNRWRRHVVSWSSTLLVLTCALYPLMSARFFVYEETICYFQIFELFALAAYVFALPSFRALPVAAIAAAGGMAMLVRPTGAVYLAMWAAIVAFESRRWRAVAAFMAAAAPFVGFWFYSNWLKSGSPFSFGMENSMPYWGYHTTMLRFGSRCVDTPAHMLECAWLLFEAMFVAIGDPKGYLSQCHYSFETRPPDGQSYAREPFFGVFVLVLLLWMLADCCIRRRQRRLSHLVPYGAFALLFAAYAHGGIGFAWRYQGDFWPIIVLATVQYVRTSPPAIDRQLGLKLAGAVLVYCIATYARCIGPAQSTIETIDAKNAASFAERFRQARYGTDASLPSRVTCGSLSSWPYHNGQGWLPRCAVDTSTTVFVGVPKKAGRRYELRFETRGMTAPTLRVYVNGRIYSAHRTAQVYAADLDIAYSRLWEPIVMVTIEWTPGVVPPAGELLSVEIG
jgi:hypothetical protein